MEEQKKRIEKECVKEFRIKAERKDVYGKQDQDGLATYLKNEEEKARKELSRKDSRK